MNPDERSARRAILWTARILIGLVLAALLAGVVRWLWQRWA